MNLKLNFIIIIGCSLLTGVVSCESHEQKADEAFDTVKKEKKLTKDTLLTIEDITVEDIAVEEKKPEVIKEKEHLSDWDKFKIETEKKILINEELIKEIKGKPNASSKLLKTMISLEKDNNDLRKNMDQYKEEVKVMWEKFKTKINHDANEIHIELKDIKLNNIK